MQSITCLSSAPSVTSFKIGEPVNNSPFLQFAETYAAYADNFDLSLLPQDCNTSTTENIPTTVSQYTDDISSLNLTPQTTPEIKIEQIWPPTANIDETIKQESPFTLSYEQLHRHHQRQQLLKTPNQLIPPLPPAYSHLYPSPQSSPASSEYAFPFVQPSSGCYDSLSSSRTSLYPASPCASLDTVCIKQELHILPPSPPESNCEAPSPHSACSDVKAEPLDADVEALIDLKTLFEKPQGGYFNKSSALSVSQTNLPGLALTTSSLSLPPPPLPSQEATIVSTSIQIPSQQQQDHQLLREYLEDTTFQRKHNLKPLALDSFIGGLEAVRGDIEPVISLALEHVKREADEICAKLQISQDPSAWSTKQVHAWLRSTIEQFELTQIDDLEAKFGEDGAALILLSEEEFIRRVPEIGSTLHAQLDVWKMAFTDRCQNPIINEQQQQIHQQQQQIQQQQPAIGEENRNNNIEPQESNNGSNNVWESNCISNFNMEMDEDSEDEIDDILLPTTSINNTPNSNVTNPEPKRANPSGRNGGSHIHLWQFLKELLLDPHINGTAIRWIDRSKGIFKIEDSVRVAKLWGRRKNRPAMNYDKLSRSIRQYYKKGIMKKTERSQRLVYQFCHPYHM